MSASSSDLPVPPDPVAPSHQLRARHLRKSFRVFVVWPILAFAGISTCDSWLRVAADLVGPNVPALLRFEESLLGPFGFGFAINALAVPLGLILMLLWTPDVLWRTTVERRITRVLAWAACVLPVYAVVRSVEAVLS